MSGKLFECLSCGDKIPLGLPQAFLWLCRQSPDGYHQLVDARASGEIEDLDAMRQKELDKL